MMCFALDLMTAGKIEEDVDAEYIDSLGWYHTLPEVLAVEADEENGVANGGERKGRHMRFKVCRTVSTHIRLCDLA